MVSIVCFVILPVLDVILESVSSAEHIHNIYVYLKLRGGQMLAPQPRINLVHSSF